MNPSSALETIQQLRGTSFLWESENKLKSTGKGNFGFIAQEVELILPEIVSTDSSGYKAVDYVAILPIAVEAIKELSQIIEEQSKEIEKLKSQNISTQFKSSLDNDVDKALLFSNVPNPFSKNTEIPYYLPNNTKSSFIIIYDMNGKQIKKHPVDVGEGVVSISASELKPGIYLYSLVANGMEIDTKRMIVL